MFVLCNCNLYHLCCITLQGGVYVAKRFWRESRSTACPRAFDVDRTLIKIPRMRGTAVANGDSPRGVFLCQS